jgi:hypothetical protein
MFENSTNSCNTAYMLYNVFKKLLGVYIIITFMSYFTIVKLIEKKKKRILNNEEMRRPIPAQLHPTVRSKSMVQIVRRWYIIKHSPQMKPYLLSPHPLTSPGLRLHHFSSCCPDLLHSTTQRSRRPPSSPSLPPRRRPHLSSPPPSRPSSVCSSWPMLSRRGATPLGRS